MVTPASETQTVPEATGMERTGACSFWLLLISSAEAPPQPNVKRKAASAAPKRQAYGVGTNMRFFISGIISQERGQIFQNNAIFYKIFLGRRKGFIIPVWIAKEDRVCENKKIRKGVFYA